MKQIDTTVSALVPQPRWGWLLFSTVLLSGATAIAFAWLRYQAKSEREEGLRLAQLGRFEDAAPFLGRALERKADDLDVIKALALGLVATGQLTEAEPYLSDWCVLRPDDAGPFKLRMDARHRRARATAAAADKQRIMAEAIADGQRALGLDAQDDAVAQEVVWLLLQVERLEEADQLCRRCLERQPSDPWLTYLLARIAHARGTAAEAQALLNTLLQRYPRFTQGLLLRAVLHNEAGEPGKAVPLLRQVLSLDRAYEQEARYQLSLALARTGQTEEAQRLMAEVEKTNLGGLRRTEK